MKAVILIDSREKRNEHIVKQLNELGVLSRVQVLRYGDYSFELNGKSFEKEIVIERKNSITELCGNLGKNKTRFQNEFIRAARDKCKVILMVEDGNWERIENHEYRSQFSPVELKNRIKTWCNKFQLELKFVQKKDACNFILGCFREFYKNDLHRNKFDDV
jgi:ERCC4-type nuclease